METVTLNKAAKLVGKSTSVISKALDDGKLKADKNDKGEWQIDTVDLFALYPETDKQKCERLGNELNNYKSKVLSLENEIVELKIELENATLKRQELENESASTNNNQIAMERSDEITIKDNELYKINLIKELSTFINKNNLLDNSEILLMFRRFLGSLVSQRNAYTAPQYVARAIIANRALAQGIASPKPEFSYFLKDNDFYNYLMYGWIPNNISDTHVQDYLQFEFYEEFADANLYRYR
jgi:hypothetical protein